MCNLTALNFGANKEHINVNSHTKFTMNLIIIHSVMNVYSCKKDQILPWLQGKPSMGLICIGVLIIVVVPFDGVKNNGVTATEL